MHGFATGFIHHLLDHDAWLMSGPGVRAAARGLLNQSSKAWAPLQFTAWHEGCNASGGDWHFSRRGLRWLTPANEEKQPLVAI
jgi:hypothetical protein